MFFFADTNECLIGNGGCMCDYTLHSAEYNCSVQCNNTVGSFACICGDGYMLDTDELTCVGKLAYIVTMQNLIHCLFIGIPNCFEEYTYEYLST